MQGSAPSAPVSLHYFERVKNMKSVTEEFGSLVFDDRAMKARLTGEVYHAMKQTIKQGKPLNPSIANAVAAAQNEGDSLNTAQRSLPQNGFDRRGGFIAIAALCYMFAAIQIALILAMLAYLIISRFNRRSYNEVIANMRSNQ